MTIKTVGVIGAGQMGNGIAHVFASAGFDVLINDINPDAVTAAIAKIDKNMTRLVERGQMDAVAQANALERIRPATGLPDIAQTDLVIEAATENEAVKRQIFEALVPDLKDNTILTTNTSSISITRLATVTDRPERFMGFHFMNPVPMMQLVEVIRGIATDDETVSIVRDLTGRLGKQAVAAEDFPAFIVNRILLPMLNEAVYTLYEGVGSVEAIDTAMKLGANHPMGPLELSDLVGLDVRRDILNGLAESFEDDSYRPHPLLNRLVAAGDLGRKTGRGIYEWGTGEKRDRDDLGM